MLVLQRSGGSATPQVTAIIPIIDDRVQVLSPASAPLPRPCLATAGRHGGFPWAPPPTPALSPEGRGRCAGPLISSAGRTPRGLPRNPPTGQGSHGEAPTGVDPATLARPGEPGVGRSLPDRRRRSAQPGVRDTITLRAHLVSGATPRTARPHQLYAACPPPGPTVRDTRSCRRTPSQAPAEHRCSYPQQRERPVTPSRVTGRSLESGLTSAGSTGRQSHQRQR